MRCLFGVASLVVVVVVGLGARPLSGKVGQDRPGEVVAAWASGPMEARVALRDASSPEQAEALVGREIQLWPRGEAGPKPLAVLRIAGILRADDGRTLILRTDPHPGEGLYRLAGKGIEYGLSGVEAKWFEGAELAAGLPEGEATWEGWGPSFDPVGWREDLAGSVEHERLAGLLEKPGVLVLRSLVEVPEEGGVLAVVAGQGAEGEVSYAPLEFEGEAGARRAEAEVESLGEPVELLLMVETGGEIGRVRVAIGEQEVALADLILPWAPPAVEEPGEPGLVPVALEGGDAARGEAIFVGDQAKCSSCHRVGEKGTAVGPDLTGLAGRMDRAAIYREIESPSTVIHPDYRPYTVAARDGRVAAGIVRAEGPDTIRVLDTTGKATVLSRDEVEEMSPSATSIMPVGLVGVIGEAGMRDLMAYLEGLK